MKSTKLAVIWRNIGTFHNHFVGPLVAPRALGGRWSHSWLTLDRQLSLIKAGCDMDGRQITATSRVTLGAASSATVRSRSNFTSRSPTRQKWLWYESRAWHNHFYDRDTDTWHSSGYIYKQGNLRKPTTSKWLWYEHGDMSPPLWQARPENYQDIQKVLNLQINEVRSSFVDWWYKRSRAHQSWLW